MDRQREDMPRWQNVNNWASPWWFIMFTLQPWENISKPTRKFCRDRSILQASEPDFSHQKGAPSCSEHSSHFLPPRKENLLGSGRHPPVCTVLIGQVLGSKHLMDSWLPWSPACTLTFGLGTQDTGTHRPCTECDINMQKEPLITQKRLWRWHVMDWIVSPRVCTKRLLPAREP